MIKEPQVNLFEMAMCLSDAMDLISMELGYHHKEVAYIAFQIGFEMGLPFEQRNELLLAGSLHDSGALSLKSRVEAMKFEKSFDIEGLQEHAEIGYQLLKNFKTLFDLAKLVRYHHTAWNFGEGTYHKEESVPLGSHILHLADRVAILKKKEVNILGQVEEITKKVKENSGRLFMPELVDVFLELAKKEYFWLDIISPSLDMVLSRVTSLETIDLDLEKLLSLGRLLMHIIDFRSSFTATHSSGVSASAETLAGIYGFSGRECQQMRLAGYLHDLGKLAVPKEILEKPDKLTIEEFDVIRKHTYYTYRVLEDIKDLELINTWAAFHHERLNGNGYPFHHQDKDLVLGSRIMAVADVFTAITEDRPYRRGMSKEQSKRVLLQMAKDNSLDTKVVSTLIEDFDHIASIRETAQKLAVEEYQGFRQQFQTTFR